METFEDFVKGLIKILNIKQDIEKLTISEQQKFISKINEYLYTNYEGIGTTHELDEDFEYLSDFHKYWEKNHEKILNPQIDEVKCELAAEVLHNIYKEYGENPFRELYDTHKLTPEEICKIRFLTANQDFRGSRDFKFLARDPTMGKIAKAGWMKFGFPLSYNSDALEVMYAFALAGIPSSPEMHDALELIKAKSQAGRWINEKKFPSKMYAEIDPYQQASKWLTYRAIYVLQFYKQLSFVD
ncbi:MAG: hypothetical protein JXA54_04220 [Candidatus Heimdallarchaeota archaeon]|nr:hypothetical protein [Candidatus Heimdallarchaeota archaeon]